MSQREIFARLKKNREQHTENIRDLIAQSKRLAEKAHKLMALAKNIPS